MHTDYIIVIPLCPIEYMTPLRTALRDICFHLVEKIRASTRVILLGEHITAPESFEFLETHGRSKEDKLYELGAHIERSGYRANWFVRLDDDDLINTSLLDEYVNDKDSDAVVDYDHGFYDLSSGHTSLQQRDWFPNTMLHRFHHAMQKIPAVGGSTKAGGTNYLFACDHSKAWKDYYADMSVDYCESVSPLYLRVLCPGSITSIRADDYFAYLKTFGNWDADFPYSTDLKSKLISLWEDYEGKLKQYPSTRNGFYKKIKHRFAR